MADDINISASMHFDEETATNMVDALGEEVDKPTPDRLAGALANRVVGEYLQSLAENGSTVTYTGINSIRSQHLGPGIYGVMIASYLDQVDEGRNSGNHPPVANNTRLQRAAEKYGINPYALAQSIANKGTIPKPFKEKALERVRADAGADAQAEMEKVMDRVEKARR